MSILTVQNVSKAFGGVRALNDVSFSVSEGKTLGLMGANGAGKTTMFSVIAGHNRPDTGGVQFDGKAIDGLKPDRISRIGIARTFQIVRPFRGLTTLENVITAARFGAKPAGSTSVATARARTVLEEVGLADQAEQLADSLTLAAQKKLEVAKALATAPRLLLLDEVMAGLTPSEVRAMMAMIVDVQARYDLTFVIIEHVMHALMDLSEYVVVLHHGEKIAEGAPAEIADNPDVQQAYLGSAKPKNGTSADV